jgi:hypothetical protein
MGKKITLTTGQAFDMLMALRQISPQAPQPPAKFSGTTRITLAIVQNLIEPFAVGFEKARTDRLVELGGGADDEGKFKKPITAAMELDFQKEMFKARSEPVEISNWRFIKLSDLKLDENEHITAQQIQMLWPMIEDVDTEAAAA